MFIGRTNRETSMSLTMQVEPGQRLISAERLVPFALLLLLGAVDAVWAASIHVRFIGVELNLYFTLILLAVGIFYHSFRKDRRLFEISYYAALWSLMMAVAPPLTYLCATFNFRLYDDDLVMLDKMLGFDWPNYYKFFTNDKTIAAIFLAIYFSMLLQLFFSVIYFSHVRKYHRNSELFWVAFISLVITSLLSGIFPATGALHYYNTGLNHAVHLHDYAALRSGSISEFVLRDMQGIITFPSFHTAAAVMLAYAYRGTRMFIPVFCLNVLMLLATPVFGGHYLVDLLGGAGVALVSIPITYYLRAFLREGLPTPAQSSGSRTQVSDIF